MFGISSDEVNTNSDDSDDYTAFEIAEDDVSKLHKHIQTILHEELLALNQENIKSKVLFSVSV